VATPIDADRPRPVRDAAGRAAKSIGILSALVVATVGWGLLTTAQGNAIVGLLGLIPGVLTAAASALAAFRVAQCSEPQVTPTSSPMTDDGRRLVPADHQPRL
jgi:hypothetical protein